MSNRAYCLIKKIIFLTFLISCGDGQGDDRNAQIIKQMIRNECDSVIIDWFKSGKASDNDWYYYNRIHSVTKEYPRTEDIIDNIMAVIDGGLYYWHGLGKSDYFESIEIIARDTLQRNRNWAFSYNYLGLRYQVLVLTYRDLSRCMEAEAGIDSLYELLYRNSGDSERANEYRSLYNDLIKEIESCNKKIEYYKGLSDYCFGREEEVEAELEEKQRKKVLK
jgi:hypothetical protein